MFSTIYRTVSIWLKKIGKKSIQNNFSTENFSEYRTVDRSTSKFCRWLQNTEQDLINFKKTGLVKLSSGLFPTRCIFAEAMHYLRIQFADYECV